MKSSEHLSRCCRRCPLPCHEASGGARFPFDSCLRFVGLGREWDGNMGPPTSVRPFPCNTPPRPTALYLHLYPPSIPACFISYLETKSQMGPACCEISRVKRKGTSIHLCCMDCALPHSEPRLFLFRSSVPPLVTRVTGSRALSTRRRCLAASSAVGTSQRPTKSPQKSPQKGLRVFEIWRR